MSTEMKNEVSGGSMTVDLIGDDGEVTSVLATHDSWTVLPRELVESIIAERRDRQGVLQRARQEGWPALAEVLLDAHDGEARSMMAGYGAVYLVEERGPDTDSCVMYAASSLPRALQWASERNDLTGDLESRDAYWAVLLQVIDADQEDVTGLLLTYIHSDGHVSLLPPGIGRLS